MHLNLYVPSIFVQYNIYILYTIQYTSLCPTQLYVDCNIN